MRSSPAARRSASRSRSRPTTSSSTTPTSTPPPTTPFDKSGIAKNAREEKIRARDAKLKQDAENARMAKLYRKEILQEPDLPGGFVAIGEIGGLGGIKPAPKPNVEVVNTIHDEETVAGD